MRVPRDVEGAGTNDGGRVSALFGTRAATLLSPTRARRFRPSSRVNERNVYTRLGRSASDRVGQGPRVERHEDNIRNPVPLPL